MLEDKGVEGEEIMELIINNGKVVEPTSGKKIAAVIARDPIASINLPIEIVQRIMVDHLWKDCKWLEKYEYAQMLLNADNTYTFVFSNEK